LIDFKHYDLDIRHHTNEGDNMTSKVFWGINSLRSSPDVVGNPTLILIGDSWFWYPFNNLASELAAQLNGEHKLLVLGNNGAEAQDWNKKYRNEIGLAFEWYASTASALLLSGGGNDIAGPEDFDPIIEDDCSKATDVSQCYSPGQPEAILSNVKTAFQVVIGKFRKYNATVPVICHNYEKAWPTGKGLFGPADWLKLPMDDGKVPKGLRHDLFVDLIDRLYEKQRELAKPSAGLGKIIPLQTAGTLPDKEDIWANELHLKPGAFDKMVKLAWLPALKKIGIS